LRLSVFVVGPKTHHRGAKRGWSCP